MNAERLLAHYERIADAPDAVARLRRFILDLAVRGRLVPQDPHDEPAAELLKRIASEKERLTIAVNKRIYDRQGHLPIGWVGVTLADYAIDVFTGPFGSALHQSDYVLGGIPLVNPSHMIDDRIVPDDKVSVSSVTAQRLKSYWLESGDIVMARRGEVGRAALVSRHQAGWLCGTGSFFLRFTAEVNRQFFLLVLRSASFRSYLAEKAVGTTMVNLNHGILRTAPLMVPPLAEQHRIVAKVDELMALCDRLEAARAQREATRNRLMSASLARLNAPDPVTFRDDTRFALAALPAFTTRVDQIKQLRQTILNLAVRGKLLAQTQWHAKLMKVGDVASLQNGYAFKSEWFLKSGTRLLRNVNVGHGNLDWSDQVCLPENHVTDYERFQLREGDVVLSLDRPFIVTGTKVARVTTNDLPALLLQRVGRFVLSRELHPDYLFLWINSPHFSEQINPGRSNGVPHISSKQVESAVLFLPPLAEQRRIVAKVDELMALCDRLEASLARVEDTRRRLLEALLHEALAPADTRRLAA